MSTHSLIDHLIDFGDRRQAARPLDQAPSLAPVFGETPFGEAEPEAGPPQPDIDALIADAVAEAESALAERLNAEAEEKLAADRERHAAELASVQEQFAAETSEKLLQQLAEMETRLTELTTTVVARLLTPVLSADVQARAVERLATLISEAVRDSDAVRIHVQGSAALFEALRQHAGDWANSIHFTENGDPDLTVTIDESVYQTRLADWSRAVAETVA